MVPKTRYWLAVAFVALLTLIFALLQWYIHANT